ncbi:hypothetical protein GTY54_23030 [Streptomyces sp. SID625]|nr:hypothetical protein [Streptomyces sp. SID625]
MRSYGFTWTAPDGTPRASAVGYDEVSAGRRRDELEKAGATDIDRVEVKPGELRLSPARRHDRGGRLRYPTGHRPDAGMRVELSSRWGGEVQEASSRLGFNVAWASGWRGG